ncbi:MAG: hypothetical protein CL726_12055 [Chloroflexi bacterium]|nr:hypothetical protein [Chloroflexota bacterium]
MKFLAIFVIIVFHRNWTGSNPVSEKFQVESWFSWVSQRVSPGDLSFLASVVVPALLLLIISWQLSGWLLGLFWLAISVLVLLYSIEVIDTDIVFDDQVLWLRSLREGEELAKLQQTQSGFRSDITYEVFQSLVPAVFWFLLLGPAGTLLFTLCHHYDEDDVQSDLIEPLLFWMEWIPARFTILLFALLGEFGRTWAVLEDSLTDVENSAAVCLHEAVKPVRTIADDASVEDFVLQTEDELVYLKDLLERSLWGWAGIAGLLTIAGL